MTSKALYKLNCPTTNPAIDGMIVRFVHYQGGYDWFKVVVPRESVPTMPKGFKFVWFKEWVTLLKF